MKRVVFTLAMTMMVGFCFGQKKVLSSAKNEIKGNKPNIEEARRLIKEAMADSETKNEAETWYVAGLVENKQLDLENTKEMLGQSPNLAVMYDALNGILPYFEKSYAIDQTPDEKGKVKPKFTKDMRAILKANRVHYINAGLFFYEKQDYQKAYDNFKFYGDLPSHPIMAGEEFPKQENDSTDLQVRYYAGIAASLIPNHKEAVVIYSEMKDKGYNENEIYQRLVYEYEQLNDSVSLKNTLKEGADKFPGDDYFLLNLINININAGNSPEAIALLQNAIKNDPANAQLYDVLGQVLEADGDYDGAIANLEKSLEIEPGNPDYQTHLGRVYYNLGVETRANADDNIANNDLYKQKLDQSLEYFKKALPYFEKAFELQPENTNTIYALRSIYYNLGMKEFEKMDEIYNNAQ